MSGPPSRTTSPEASDYSDLNPLEARPDAVVSVRDPEGGTVKLLIAEDDVFFQQLLREILESDHEVIVAKDGNEAWAALQHPDPPRLAILDWVMPGLSGPQICRKVRACPELSSMYLIILTARNNEADIVSGLRAGADDYITKPPIAAELRARIRVGERVVALQDSVEAQSVLLKLASGRESHGAEGIAGCDLTGRLHGQEDPHEVDRAIHDSENRGSRSISHTNIDSLRRH